MRRFAALFSILILLSSAGSTLAAGSPGTVSITIINPAATHATELVNPCTGNVVTAYTAGRSVEHLTTFTNSDEFWYTFTATADAWFNDGAIAYRGHDTFWVGVNQNERNMNFTLTDNGVLFGSDGSRVSLREHAHVTVDAHGVITVWFDVTTGTCR